MIVNEDEGMWEGRLDCSVLGTLIRFYTLLCVVLSFDSFKDY